MEKKNKILKIFTERFEYIIPDKIDAKVLFFLFLESKGNPEKISYSETEIRELIRTFYKQENEGEREQRQKVEERFQMLLRQQFIDRGRDKRIILSDYSTRICILFYEKIQPLLNPSVIEKILEDVKVTLRNSCGDIENLKRWYNTQFTRVLKTEIANQTLAMDYQIQELKNKLNKKFKVLSYEELVDYSQKQMDIVIENRKKLTIAFYGLDEISDILANTPLNRINDLDFIDIKRNLNETLEHYKYKLEQAENNITRIKDIVRSLFDIVSKKAFDRKLETFFYKILEESQTESRVNRTNINDALFYSVEITLPNYVNSVSVIRDYPDKFLHPEFYEDFSVPKNQKIELIDRSRKNLELAAQKSRRRQEQARKIEGWLRNLKDRLLIKNEVDYSTFYMEMLQKENDIELAIKGTEHIIHNLRKEKYEIITSQEYSVDHNNSDNSIWKIRIKK